MRRFNLEEFIWLLVLVCINAGIIYLINSRKIDFYIGDKMTKYMYMTIVLISILIIFQIANVFTPKGNGSLYNKVLPIILALIIGFISVKAQNSFKHNELYNNLLNNYEEIHNHESQLTKEEINNYIADGNIIINEKNLEILMDMRKNPDDYIGKKLELNGFVCRESILSENMFMIGRVHTTCCAADSMVVGILAQYEDSKSLNENEWVNIKGSISYTTINDDDGISHRVPVVQISNLEKVENKKEK